MIWISLALLTAFLQSIRTVMEKKMDHKVRPYALLWLSGIVGLPLYGYFAWRDGFSVTSNWFWLVALVASLGGVISHALYISAVQKFDISKMMPITIFSPLFILLGEVIFLQTYPTLLGGIGIVVMIGGGVYFFWDSEDEHSLLDVFHNIVRERDSLQMFLAVILMSGLGVLDKVGLNMSGPGMYLFTAYAMYVGILCGYFFLYPTRLVGVFRFPIFAVGASIVNALMFLAQTTAMTYTLVANVMAVKRFSIVLTILYGYWFFSETHIAHRLKAAMIMIAGVLLITIYG
jgi:drug/metabolite transporter (DMT)-like permease